MIRQYKLEYDATPHQDDAQQALLTEAEQLLKLDYAKIRDDRFVKGIFCPHCMHTTGKAVSNYVLYGFVRGTRWQRYHCRKCNRIFSDLTRTFFHRSRNVDKWPKFIHLTFVDKLPAKEVAAELELHINTIYTWRKKLSAFFELYLPNKRFHPSDRGTYQYTNIKINVSNKGRSSNKNTDNPNPSTTSSHPNVIPATIAVNLENPSVILFTMAKDHIHHSNEVNIQPSAPLSNAIEEFHSYLAIKRGVSSRHLNRYMTDFRMLKLIEAINPAIVATELFNLCLDKGNLSRSNRLLKRLI